MFLASLSLWMGDKELLNETFSLCLMISSPPWWHARWRSRGICILLKYFHSLKYFSGVENISPWQSWYKSLCYLYPTVRDIRCWYICCFWLICLPPLYYWNEIFVENSRGGQNRELFDLTTNTIEFEKKVEMMSAVGLIICYTLFTTRQSSTFLEL